MRGQPRVLYNTAEIEIWPHGLLRARSNHDARTLARARHVLRRKRDGRYLAAVLPTGILPLVERLPREPGLGEALALLDALDAAPPAGLGGVLRDPRTLPLNRLHERLHDLHLDEAGYAARTGLALVPEPVVLAFSGFDRYRRPLWLVQPAARAWSRLRQAAAADGIALEAISGYRSHDYQLGIFQRKLDRGQSVEQILEVNAAPGFSEHHSGLALDLSCPGEPPAEESFEATPAFAWLQARAASHGFHMSYPRQNPHGIVYEPWHWRFDPTATAAPGNKEPDPRCSKE